MGESRDKNLNDLTHERAVWKVEHWGWALFALTLLASIIGLFGEGPLGHATAANTHFSVEYDRFARHQAQTKLKIHLKPAAGGTLPALWFSKEFIERIEMEHIVPQPERVKVSRNSIVYIFDVANTNDAATIAFEFKPAAYGRTPVKIGLVNGPEIQFAQFFYP